MDGYVWVQMFCSVKGWQHHPGNKHALTTAQCASVADEMFSEYLKRKSIWDGWQQQQSDQASSKGG